MIKQKLTVTITKMISITRITLIQANYWWGQMHCGPPNQNFGRAIAHPAHAAAPPMHQAYGLSG